MALTEYKKYVNFISVKDKKILNPLIDAGLHVNLARKVFRVLEDELIIEVSGVKSGMKYRATEILTGLSDIDLDSLVRKIADQVPDILKVKEFSKPLSKRLVTSTSTMRQHIFTPGEVCYVLCDEQISKATVVQSQFVSFQRMLEEMTQNGMISASKEFNSSIEYYVLTEKSQKLFRTRNVFATVDGLLFFLRSRYNRSL